MLDAVSSHLGNDFIIRASDLMKYYEPGSPIFENIDFGILKGERVALIGPNGAGKSTLLKCLIGLHGNSGGTITTMGETFDLSPTVAQSKRLRGRIGFVFQQHGLVGRLSVLSNVVHGKIGQINSWRVFCQTIAPKEWRDVAMDALEAVSLGDKALKRADSLSGGQQQRVAIARALVRKPELMIADEPAASLDPSAGRDVMSTFSDLVRSKGITLLFTSHDMDHAIEYSDRIIALKNGVLHFDLATSSVSTAMLEEVFNG